MMMSRKILMMVLIQLACFNFVSSQITITNVNIQPFNLTPEGLLRVNIMNNENAIQVQIMAELFNSSGLSVMTVKSQNFLLKKGLNSDAEIGRRVLTFNYGMGPVSEYIKTTHTLPSGRYKVCISIFPSGGADKLDDYCDEVEAEYNQYLYLVNPFDGDTVETKNPVLFWTHSEPFSILGQGEYYRMVVSEIKKGQSPDDAITVNTPVMVKNYLNDHQLLYPYDARELKNGMSYAWQVQKLSDGIIVNKTEAWKIVIKPVKNDKSLKYVALRNKLDGDYYTAYNGKVYFKFSEEYKTAGKLNFRIIDAKHKPINLIIIKDTEEFGKENSVTGAQLKSKGSNFYDLDLNGSNLNTGYYTLEVKNEKKEIFYLKIMLP